MPKVVSMWPLNSSGRFLREAEAGTPRACWAERVCSQLFLVTELCARGEARSEGTSNRRDTFTGLSQVSFRVQNDQDKLCGLSLLVSIALLLSAQPPSACVLYQHDCKSSPGSPVAALLVQFRDLL